MKIVSFDIGIKHLSFCVMKYRPNKPCGKQFKIYSWEVLNLTGHGNTKCQGTFKSGKNKGENCSKKGVYRHDASNETPIYYCKLHHPDKKNLKKAKNSKDLSPFELNVTLVKELDKHPKILNVDRVVLELQPKINNKMKVLSHVIYGYFIIRGFIDKPVEQQTLKNIVFVHAGNKLCVYNGPEVTSTYKTKYRRDKDLAESYCKYMIRHNKKWVEKFDDWCKKDDASDSFLQGAWYLKIYINKEKVKSTYLDTTKPKKQRPYYNRNAKWQKKNKIKTKKT